MNSHYRSGRRSLVERIVTSISIALLLSLAAGCASINRLREAQDAFNQSAAAENALRIDTKAPDAVANIVSVRSGYASALLSLQKMDNSDESQLRKDGLWGTALTLKALTQWRLAKFKDARDSAESAIKTAGDQMYPRDLAIMTALPGLIKTDQAYSLILSNASGNDVTNLLMGVNGAIVDIEKGRRTVDKNHPVQTYLLQAELAAYSNYQMALDRLFHPPQTVSTNDPARIDAKARLKELNQLFELQKAGQDGANLVKYWKDLFGFDSL